MNLKTSYKGLLDLKVISCWLDQKQCQPTNKYSFFLYDERTLNTCPSMFGSEAKSLVIEKFSTTLKSAGEFIYNFVNYLFLPNAYRRAREGNLLRTASEPHFTYLRQSLFVKKK